MPNEPLVVYHNPRCGTCRKLLALLDARGLKPRLVHYMDREPLAAEAIAELARMAGLSPRELLRTRDPAYLERGLDDPGASDAAACAAMADSPGLMQRPIVVAGDRAALARPPERALSIL